MGGELVGLPPNTQKERFPYTKLFWQAYPAYISYGMSYDEYWNGDAESCTAYRKAHEERLKLEDAMLWRQGLYFYHALCNVAPMFAAFKPQKPHEYLKEPFGFEQPKHTDDAPQKGIDHVMAWMKRVNDMRKQNNGS